MTPEDFIKRLKSRIRRVGYDYATPDSLDTDSLTDAVIDNDETFNDTDSLVEHLITGAEEEIIESKRAALSEQADKEKTEAILTSQIYPSLRGKKI